jgi:ribonuclease inhibitor
MTPNNRFERSRGVVFGEPRRRVDDLDKAVSLGVNATPRRSTSSLDDMTDVSAIRFLLDVGDIDSSAALHESLASIFSFPDYYGRNWDAFDECIAEIPMPAVIDVAGLFTLRSRLPRDASLLMTCLTHARSHALPGNLVVNIV